MMTSSPGSYDAQSAMAVQSRPSITRSSDRHSPTFSELAAECRAMMADRKHTPSEILQREGREER